MMICRECAKAAEINAKRGDETPHVMHPDNCGCPCQHKPVGSWKGDLSSNS